MGLIRLGILGAICVALLPSDSEQQEILYNRATQAAKWTFTFCERNAQTCATASSAWTEFSKKAQFGAKLAFDTLSEQLAAKTSTSSLSPAAAAYKAAADDPPPSSRVLETGTLNRSDLEPNWRGTAKKPARAESKPKG